MVKFYVEKIKNEVINPATEEAWKIEDVPKLWRGKVEKELQDNPASDSE
ncbi:MAG: hypothetical protein SOX32_12795 [Candidatus Choladocola sp.]|nr:hypothetical protein [Candidatus Choladocola sp.]